MTFSTLGLSDKVQSAVASAGYTEPTPIQRDAIPHILARRDVIGLAQTGTGKTAAFTLPMLTLLEHGRARARMPRTLILEPTRELAAQVENNFIKYGVNHKLNIALLIGGVSFGDQDAKIMRGADVLIATPGRLLDHFERGKLLLTGIEIFVIDEADRMLDMGFIPDIERICKMVPFTRQTLFFSATMPPEIKKLTSQFLSNPVMVETGKPSSTATTITQALAAAGDKPFQKREVLRKLLGEAVDLQNAIIFCNRKREVADLHKSLVKHGFKAGALHGDMDQSARTATLESFRKGELPLLVASDVAARGLDIPEVSHVFNFDMPHHSEDYVHRIGRTGRAGRKGTAYTITSKADDKSLKAIEDLIGNKIDYLPNYGPNDLPAADSSDHESRAPRRRTSRDSRDNNKDKPRRDNKAQTVRSAENALSARPARRTNEPPANDAVETSENGGFANDVPAFLRRAIRPK